MSRPHSSYNTPDLISESLLWCRRFPGGVRNVSFCLENGHIAPFERRFFLKAAPSQRAGPVSWVSLTLDLDPDPDPDP